jgi:hypothetical protein
MKSFNNLFALSFILLILYNISQVIPISKFQINKKSRNQHSSTLSKLNIIGRNEAEYPCTTPLFDSDRGNIRTLKNLSVDCHTSSILTGFHLWGKHGLISNEVAIEYSCIKIAGIPNFYEIKNSNIAEFQNSHSALFELGKLKVSCQSGTLLSSFSLLNENNQIQYKYRCASVNNEQCQNNKTAYHNVRYGFFGNASISCLDKFKIKTNEGYGLKSFNIETLGNSMRYNWEECLIVNTK